MHFDEPNYKMEFCGRAMAQPSLARTFANYLAKYKRTVIPISDQIRQQDSKTHQNVVKKKKKRKEKTGKDNWPPLTGVV